MTYIYIKLKSIQINVVTFSLNWFLCQNFKDNVIELLTVFDIDGINIIL